MLMPFSPSTPLVPSAAHRRITPAVYRGHAHAAALPARNQSAGGDRTSVLVLQQTVSVSSPPIISSRPSSPAAELGFLSLLLALSMVMGSFFAVAAISLPAMGAPRKLNVAMDKLSRTAAEEVPGTLMSLRLSAMEISELTQKLGSLRRLMPGTGRNDKEREAERRAPPYF